MPFSPSIKPKLRYSCTLGYVVFHCMVVDLPRAIRLRILFSHSYQSTIAPGVGVCANPPSPFWDFYLAWAWMGLAHSLPVAEFRVHLPYCVRRTIFAFTHLSSLGLRPFSLLLLPWSWVPEGGDVIQMLLFGWSTPQSLTLYSCPVVDLCGNDHLLQGAISPMRVERCINLWVEGLDCTS